MKGETCWTLIRSAARGEPEAREDFGRRYLPAVRSYLTARWGGKPLASEVQDAAQEVFLRCCRADGPLERVEEDRPEGFQAYLRGICRNVALEFEGMHAKRMARAPSTPPDLDGLPGNEMRLTVVFDRTFAIQLMQEARALQSVRASAAGDAAQRRLEVLRLRFEEDLAIRTIATRWKAAGHDADPAELHHEYARARQEFRRALIDTVAYHNPGKSAGEVEAAALRLLDALNP